jgi:hypothetical protein
MQEPSPMSDWHSWFDFACILLTLFIVGQVFVVWRWRRILSQYRAGAGIEPADEVTLRVKRFLAKFMAEDVANIFLAMTLEDDLGITGDDADDLFEEFARQFPDVNLDGLDLSRHFYPEGIPWGPGPCRRCPLRVFDLVEAVRDKRWRQMPNMA